MVKNTSEIPSRPLKKATNLSINKELLDQAREFNINLSQTLEEAITQKLKLLRRERWLEENKNAIEDYNEHIEKNGVFSDGFRRF